MTFRSIVFEKVSYRYEAMTDFLFSSASISFQPGWTGIVGANGAGKTTVLKLACGLLEPSCGVVQFPAHTVYCAQRTDKAPETLALLLGTKDRWACEIKGRLNVLEDWNERWDSLSHGERKRAQIAVALWREPEVLALDEPTNHIDADARALLISALNEYRGIGLLVSHDREMLDSLCRSCLFVEPPKVMMRPGNYSSGHREALREEEYVRSRKQSAKQQVARMRTEAQRRVAAAQAAQRNRSKKDLDLRDHDGRRKIDFGRWSGVDAQAPRLARRMQDRLERAQQAAAEITVRKEYELGIWLEGERCKRDTLFRLNAGALALGGSRKLHYPNLTMKPTDRIALTGANGAGKSTLIRHILCSMDLPPERLTYVPQEIDLASSCRILDEARRQPPETLGSIMTVVRRLGSRPAGLLESTEPSPGELRKLLLALGIALHPYLIIMDEPTNHLDLPSIECLENALIDCPCGLLLVSHDQQFLQKLTRIRWHIGPNSLAEHDQMQLNIE
jgi:macrolide transport system ATP-binding/permease protein